jgi:2-deoxy-D-gluconate 3-dehydrogenase
VYTVTQKQLSRKEATMPNVLELFSLSGQTAIVTGGTRGIGQALAVGLAEAGADIILAQRDASNTETKSQIESLGRKCAIYVGDFTREASVNDLLPTILADGHAPTILVNCAGIQRRYKAEEFPDNEWNAVIQVNLNSVFSLSRDFGAYLLSKPPSAVAGRRGSIINVASIMSFQGGILVPAYAAAKGGVAQLTKAMSNEWASKGINVNAIAPGYVKTELTKALVDDPVRGPSILDRTPVGRWGSPDDFKGVVVWLASRASSFVCGEIVTVDGGWMAR